MNVQLLVIDPQNDFCDPRGSLYISGANADIKRVADMIRKYRNKINQIDITLDSHHWFHIAHPMFWLDNKGEKPEPFTTINLSDIEGIDLKWRPKDYKFNEYVVKYIKALENNNRYKFTVWPPHCLIGSWGHNIFAPLMDAILFYEDFCTPVQYHIKGTNPLTEHYSIVKADVIDENDPNTKVNIELLNKIENADISIFTGEALSHCVANTIRDVITELGTSITKKLVLLEDATSNILGFESYGTNFLDEMKDLGLRISTTESVFK